jgi:hypothetical protein
VATRTKKDKSGKLEKLANSIIKKDFPDLRNVNIIFTYRKGKPRMNHEARIVLGRARILPTWVRDNFGVDCEVEVSEKMWKTMDEDAHTRLMFHELRHLQIEMDGDGNPLYDKEGRIKCYCDPHDINIVSFREEIRRFGVDEGDLPTIQFFAEINHKIEKGKLKVRKRDKLDDDNDFTFD